MRSAAWSRGSRPATSRRRSRAPRAGSRPKTGQRTIVGVNAFTEQDQSEIEILRIGEEAGQSQRERLERLRAERDRPAVDAALERLGAAAEADENLMPPMLDAARAYATLGEIRQTLEAVYGRFQEPVGF